MMLRLLPRLLSSAALLGALASPALAQDDRPIMPQAPVAAPSTSLAVPEPSAAPDASSAQILPNLQAILLLDNVAELNPKNWPAYGVVVRGENNLLKTPNFIAMLEPFVGRPLTQADLTSITQIIMQHFRTHDRPVVDVIIPEQNISKGVLQVLVLELSVGQVTFEGQEHFDQEVIANYFPLKSGDAISESEINAMLAAANSNPYRRVEAVLRAGEVSQTSDVILRTADKRPWRVYTGADNSGTESTGDRRYILGGHWGNVLGLDHRLGYQFSSSKDVRHGLGARNPGPSFRGHAANYQIPFAAGEILSFYGAYTESAPRVGSAFRLLGTSWQVSGRYAMPITLSQQVTFGLDFKRTNNNFEFGGTTLSNSYTDVLQASVAYNQSWRSEGQITQASATLFASPGDLTAYNSSNDYRPTFIRGGRAQADARYAYATVGAEHLQQLSTDFTWRVKATGQYSSTNLLGSEQIGAGGFDSVRGFAERAANGDHGVLLSNELRGPSWRIGAEDSQLQLLAFIDAAALWLDQPAVGEKQQQRLASVGVGARYNWSDTLTLRADYGHAVQTQNVSGNNRLHFSLNIGY